LQKSNLDDFCTFELFPVLRNLGQLRHILLTSLPPVIFAVLSNNSVEHTYLNFVKKILKKIKKIKIKIKKIKIKIKKINTIVLYAHFLCYMLVSVLLFSHFLIIT